MVHCLLDLFADHQVSLHCVTVSLTYTCASCSCCTDSSFLFFRFSPDLFNSSVLPGLKASLDLSAEYLILTDVQRKVSHRLISYIFLSGERTQP